MVERALSIRETTVKEVMTPRPDLFILDEDSKVGEVYPEILKKKAQQDTSLFKGAR